MCGGINCEILAVSTQGLIGCRERRGRGMLGGLDWGNSVMTKEVDREGS